MKKTPKVRIEVEGGVITEILSEVRLDIQVVDMDAREMGDNYIDLLETGPDKVFFDKEEEDV